MDEIISRLKPFLRWLFSIRLGTRVERMSDDKPLDLTRLLDAFNSALRLLGPQMQLVQSQLVLVFRCLKK